MCVMYGGSIGFGQVEVVDFVFGDQVVYGVGYIFDWYVWVDVVLVEQINMVGMQVFEVGFGYGMDVFWVVVQVGIGVCVFEIKFGGDYQFVVVGC